ncbi:DNA-binding SARP family transcriptional activator [Actinokineospora baliensis]|uniref:AfsR/SARP family transcriptional regulator n=1 Tax=Actinokineospora baliensis TaxID=547056 RepID=UPI00195BEB7C|nr:BTAD domain-containing putative transcriptional regulator [Actinokineospora baliensis]MBM7770665.1 DNA-binding SARP family transcriptional activator [Actinokineospora baliensis]
MEIRILGPIRLHGRLWTGTHRKPRGLLELLLVNANRVVSREVMIEYLWDDGGPPKPHKTLQVYLSRVKGIVERTFEDVKLRTSQNGCSIELDPNRVDYHRFRALVEKGNRSTAKGDHAQAAEHLEQAVTLWRDGHPLGSANTSCARRMRDQLITRDLVPAYRALFEAKLLSGGHEYVLRELRDVLADYPHDDTLAGQWMRALHAGGLQRDIPDFHRTFTRRLRTELNTAPSPGFGQLYEELAANEEPAADAGPPPAPALAELPRDTPYYTGRADLLRLLDEATGRDDALVAVDGPPAIGKTGLLVHWVRTRMDRFPDGVLFKDLQGFSRHSAPMDAAAVMADFLLSLGVPKEDIPGDRGELTGRLRSEVTGKRLLLVLDNVGDAEHARPLLEATTRCRVVISSRRALTSLALSDNAYLITVGPLSGQHQLDLLEARIGTRVREDPAAARRLATLTGGLPLALMIVAHLVAIRPSIPLRDLADQLGEARRILDADGHGSANGTTLRSAFTWSVAELSERERELFDLLGAHPLPEFSGGAAAAMAAIGPATEQALDGLLGAHLVDPAGTDRYRMHDLLHAFAAERAAHLGARVARAERRVVDWYLLSALAARDKAVPGGNDIPVPPVDEPVEAAEFASAESALHWFATERANLMEAIRLAKRLGLNSRLWRLSAAVYEPIRRLGYPRDALEAAELGAVAAEAVGDVEGQAGSLNNVGRVHEILHNDLEAARWYQRALALFSSIGHVYGQAVCLHNLATVQMKNEQYAAAVQLYQRSLALLEPGDGNQWAIANVHRRLGDLHTRMSNHRAALSHYHQAIVLAREINDTGGAAVALTALAALHVATDEFTTAITYGEAALGMHQQVMDRAGTAAAFRVLAEARLELDGEGAIEAEAAAGIYFDLGDDLGRADALEILGRAHSAAGAHARAAAAWRECAGLLVAADPKRAEKVGGWVRAARARAGLPVPNQRSAEPLEDTAEPTRPLRQGD